MQRLPRFSKICNLFTDFGPILASNLLGFSKDFVSADKIGVFKSAFRPMRELRKFKKGIKYRNQSLRYLQELMKSSHKFEFEGLCILIREDILGNLYYQLAY